MEQKKNGIFNAAVRMVQKSVVSGKRSSSDSYCYNEFVPVDVEEGHLAIIATDREESRRFVVPLGLLNHPIFLNLLEKAAEEYDFDCDGIVTVPCKPSEFQKILAQWHSQIWGLRV
ncbi:auxin-induced protein X10A [Mercurialis annua]|uniref:auxin-induced protein X10A n=1 Tax=Mercurialis annua TaxID=3986 RepID=UPI002160F012|nr:auxin-induced protein X10A [Mercurialis annua]